MSTVLQARKWLVYILTFSFLLLMLYWVAALLAIPNSILLVNSLYVDREPPKSNTERAIYFIPKNLSLIKVKITEKSCEEDSTGLNINYVTMLTDILFDNFTEDNPPVDKIRVRNMIRHFAEMGCNVNMRHPESKFAPIHTAFVFAFRDVDFVLELVQMGADPYLLFPNSIGTELSGEPALYLLKKIVESGKSPYTPTYQSLIFELEKRGQINEH